MCNFLDVRVDRIGERIVVPGVPNDGDAPVTIGAGFTGNIDGFRLAGLSTRTDGTTVDGLDTDGRVRLNEDGVAVLKIGFTGHQDEAIKRTFFCFGAVDEPSPQK